MSKEKLLTIAVVGLLALNLGTLALLFFNRPGPMDEPGRGAHGEGPKRIIIERLQFDHEQVAQYEMLINAHRKQIGELDNQIVQTKNRLYSTLVNEFSGQRDSLQARLGALQAQVETVHYMHFTAIKKLCRPNQLTRFNELSKDLARLFKPGKNFPPRPKD